MGGDRDGAGTDVSSQKAHAGRCGAAAKPCWLVAGQRILTPMESKGRKWAPKNVSDAVFIRGRPILGCGQRFQQCPSGHRNHLLK